MRGTKSLPVRIPDWVSWRSDCCSRITSDVRVSALPPKPVLTPKGINAVLFRESFHLKGSRTIYAVPFVKVVVEFFDSRLDSLRDLSITGYLCGATLTKIRCFLLVSVMQYFLCR